jgi:hypothetical protein
MSLWSTARALGLKTKVVPIMANDWGWNENGDSRHQYQSNFDVFNGSNSRTHDEEILVRRIQSNKHLVLCTTVKR